MIKMANFKRFGVLIIGAAVLGGAVVSAANTRPASDLNVHIVAQGETFQSVSVGSGCTATQWRMANNNSPSSNSTGLVVGRVLWEPPVCPVPTTVPPTTLPPTTQPPATTEPPATTAPPTTAPPTTQPPTTVPPTTAPPAGTQFVETFTGNTGLQRFDTGVFHRDLDTQGSNDTRGSWTGDHDHNCGNPDTQRTITKAVPSDAFYQCVDHLMTSIGHADSYSVAWFAPKQTLTDIRSVSWDVNVTDLMARQWWEVSVVSASFNSGRPTCRWCSAISWLDVSGLPAYPANSVVVGNGPFGGAFNVHANGENFNPLGWQGTCGTWGLDQQGCASKAIRRTFTLADNGNGTMTIQALGRTATFAGSFPDGEVKVVFKDHNYTPDKDGQPVGHTWHWDSIVIS